MRDYPKNRKPSGTKACPKCGAIVKARGMGAHMRLKHPVIYETKVIDIGNTVITQVAGKDLTECVRQDGKRFYTDNDLNILLGKIIYAVWDNKDKHLLGVFFINDLITDFERRFECSFADARKANPHIMPKKTDNENYQFAKKYAGLKYSR